MCSRKRSSSETRTSSWKSKDLPFIRKCMGSSMGMRSRPIGTGRENSTKNAPQGTAFHSVTLKQLPEDMSTNPRSQYAGGCFEPGTGSCSTAARPDRNGIHGTTLRVLKRKEVAMDWNRVEGNWKQAKGKV